jgi:hypothetical protein
MALLEELVALADWEAVTPGARVVEQAWVADEALRQALVRSGDDGALRGNGSWRASKRTRWSTPGRCRRPISGRWRRWRRCGPGAGRRPSSARRVLDWNIVDEPAETVREVQRSTERRHAGSDADTLKW